MENVPIFLTKLEIMNIPWVVPRPQNTPKGQRKPTDNPNALFPRSMVHYLLDILVPETEILKGWTGQTIPSDLLTVIKSKHEHSVMKEVGGGNMHQVIKFFLLLSRFH